MTNSYYCPEEAWSSKTNNRPKGLMYFIVNYSLKYCMGKVVFGEEDNGDEEG